MSFDTLITIGVIIYIIVSIRKAMKFGKDKEGGAQPAKPTGWRGKLKEMADQIKEEIEKANMDMQQQQQRKPPAPATPKPMEDEDDFFWDDEPEDDEDELELPTPANVMRESVLYEPRKKVRYVDDEEPPEESHRNHPGSQAQAVAPGLRCAHSRNRFRRRNRKHLRQAVVWSEILDKPLALRD